MDFKPSKLCKQCQGSGFFKNGKCGCVAVGVPVGYVEAEPLNIRICETEFKLSHALACLNSISERANDPELRKFAAKKMEEINFDWIGKLESLGIIDDSRKNLNS
ncbi:hypothetical protein KO537_22460 [Shewanella sp. NKUCC01_JLK]|uniref:hypothetical protein n=1 Tax=Shewanella sp. NKUCC01_JLK TaxID=2842123 RepID=UPI001C5BDDF8|nr:hypothetical protein [Shewanella sp. NKUCC01_JLK]MBW3517454.1 hypothetical protein [Shewanella sp. NKUCC01_JLK]